MCREREEQEKEGGRSSGNSTCRITFPLFKMFSQVIFNHSHLAHVALKLSGLRGMNLNNLLNSAMKTLL